MGLREIVRTIFVTQVLGDLQGDLVGAPRRRWTVTLRALVSAGSHQANSTSAPMMRVMEIRPGVVVSAVMRSSVSSELRGSCSGEVSLCGFDVRDAGKFGPPGRRAQDDLRDLLGDVALAGRVGQAGAGDDEVLGVVPWPCVTC